jgi:integral membrane sensor domain MASE1
MNRAETDIARRAKPAIRLTLQVMLVGLLCHLSTEVGFAHKLPPHNISPLWPTNAILFGVLMVTPARHWWAYTLAAYFTSVIKDARAGFPISAMLFLVADIIEVFIAAYGARRFAGGLRAFDSLRSLVAYVIVIALACFSSAFVGAFAAAADRYWFYWRVWFLSETVAFLTLAPAILTCIAGARTTLRNATRARYIEAGLIGCGLVAVSVRVFNWPTAASRRWCTYPCHSSSGRRCDSVRPASIPPFLLSRSCRSPVLSGGADLLPPPPRLTMCLPCNCS